MERKKLKPQVKVVLVILGIILFFILLENGINALGEYAENRKYQKEYEQKQEAYEKTPEYHEEQYVAGCVEQTVDLINVYDYEELYNRLDPEYKAIFDIDSEEKFKEIAKEYFGEDIDKVSLTDHHIEENRFVCEVSVYKGDTMKKNEIIVTPIDEENYYVILDDVKSIEKMPLGYNIGNTSVGYSLTHKVHKNNEMIYVFEITNRTDKPITGSLVDSKLQRTNRLQYELLNKDELENITIPANGTTKVLMSYSDKSSVSYHDDNMELSLKMSDGTVKSNTLDLSFKYWE